MFDVSDAFVKTYFFLQQNILYNVNKYSDNFDAICTLRFYIVSIYYLLVDIYCLPGYNLNIKWIL
jgi:hypothetical protein